MAAMVLGAVAGFVVMTPSALFRQLTTMVNSLLPTLFGIQSLQMLAVRNPRRVSADMAVGRSQRVMMRMAMVRRLGDNAA